MCRKVRHKTKESALIAWRKTGKNTQMNVYRCSECKSWHLGTSSSPVRKMDRVNHLIDRALGRVPS